jgi:hypothetical protein
MSMEDAESATLNIGHWTTPEEDEPELEREPGRTGRERAVALPAAVAVAALLIVVTVVGSSLSHKRPGAASTWVSGPTGVSLASPSPGVSMMPLPKSPSSYEREALAASRRAPLAPARTTAPASKAPTTKRSPSKSPSPTATPTATCALPAWPPHNGCKKHHHR